MTDTPHKPANLGFRPAPATITESCYQYMVRVSELREVISIFFGLVKTSAALSKAIAQETLDKIAAEELDGGGRWQRLVYHYSKHRQFVNEIMLSRAAESFDQYVLAILRQIFAARPQMLKSEAPVSAAILMEMKTLDEVVAHLAERKLHDLSYKPLSDLRQFIESRTGIDLFPTSELYEAALIAIELRNLIAHNDCRINEVYERRTKDVATKLSVNKLGFIALSDEWLRATSYTLDDIVFRFDLAVQKKFNLPIVHTHGLTYERALRLVFEKHPPA